MLRLLRNKQSGFLLLETVITVAILSLGLVFLCRSFIASLDSAKISSDYTQAVTLLENKLWELEMFEYMNGYFITDPPSQGGNFLGEFEGFEWNYLISPVETDVYLNQLQLEVSWQIAQRQGKLNLVTYMYAQPD